VAVTLLAVVVSLGATVSGCGGSSSKPPPSSSSSSPPPAPSPPLSKADYEARLGPLLNNRIAPALKALNANGGILNPNHLKQEIALLGTALHQMSALTPPVEVADLHQRAVAALGSTIAHLTKLRGAEQRHDAAGGIVAARAVDRDGRRLVAVGGQFTARGY
jgi:hypothetical protein